MLLHFESYFFHFISISFYYNSKIIENWDIAAFNLSVWNVFEAWSISKPSADFPKFRPSQSIAISTENVLTNYSQLPDRHS